MPDSNSNSGISKYMQQAMEEIKNHILTFYSQEDFLDKLNEIKDSQSDFRSLKNELLDMFKARKFPDDAIQNLEKATKNNFKYNYFKALIYKLVPTKKELIVDLLKDIYKIYKKFPPEQKFLARIVKRLADKDKDFSDEDPLQMQILKRFVRHTNYHTKAIEQRVLDSVSPAEKAAYAKYSAEKKRDFLIERLTEDIFIPLDVKPADYLAFFNGWVSKNNRWQKYFTITPFTIPAGTAVDETLEENFVDYLSQYNLVKNGVIVCRLDELYEKNKIAFIKDQCGIFEVLKNYKIATANIFADEQDKISKGIGNFCDWTLQEYAAFLVALIGSKPPANNTWLSDDLHKKLVKLVKDLITIKIETDAGAKAKDDVRVKDEVNEAKKDITTELTSLELLNRIRNFEYTIKATDNRKALFEEIEMALCNLDENHFKQFKKNYLIENYAEKFNDNFKEPVFGACGLTVEDFKKFLTEQIKSNKPVPYDLPADLIDNSNSATLTAYLTKNNLNVDELHSKVVFYLKQIRQPGNKEYSTVGHAFERAFKDKKKTWLYLDHTLMKIANDLASANFDNNGVNKKSLYLFAFAFNMGFNTGTNTVSKERDIVQNLFQDFYTDNFLRYNDPPTGEGINFKNFVEVIYLYFLNKNNLTPAEKLSQAEAFIDSVFAAARQNHATFDELPLSSSVYRANFFEYLDKDEQTFKQYLLANYKIYSADHSESNNRIMLASEMRTVKRNFEELVKKINAYPQDTEEWSESLFLRIIDTPDTKLEVTIEGLLIEDLVAALTALNAQLKDAELSDILKDSDFIAALKKMEDTLDVQERILNNKDFFKATRYTRSDLIALYYYYYCNFVMDNIIEWQELTNEFLYGFMDENSLKQPGLDLYLDDCGFAHFSPKILYDSFILFFLYLEKLW
ncbi:MAG: hypothetical protein IJU91_00165 [Selenomonadaceae bacterium]|nr:hypothetical protein [Selenomonadaceae bacterium]